MSTKGDLIDWKDWHDVRIYHETSEPKHNIIGKFNGWNIYVIIPVRLLKRMEIKSGHFVFHLEKNTTDLPDVFSIWGNSIISFEWDKFDEDFYFCVDGGHYLNEELEKACRTGDWSKFDWNKKI